MIIEGNALIGIGVIFVVLFLGLMFSCNKLMASQFKALVAGELDEIKKERNLLAQERKFLEQERQLLAQSRQGHQSSSVASDSDDDIAVIAAAVAAYENGL